MYRLISSLYPKSIKKRYKELLTYSNIKTEPNKFIGFVLSFGFGLALMISLYLFMIFKLNLILTLIISFIVIEVSVYMWLLLKVSAKAVFIEKVLPDALQLMASNLRAGLTVEKALLLSARPEFGPLRDEISIVGKEIAIGKEVSDALIEMSKRVSSNKLEKTTILIVSGLTSGGQLASLLEQTSSNLRNQDFVEQKIRSSIMMYVIFIFAAVSFGAPLLYGLSSFLVEVLTNVLATVDIPRATTMNLPIKFSQISISVKFIINYIITSLIATSILGALIIGLISKGEEKKGVKLIPILIILTLGIFFLVRFVISTFFGGLFNF